MGRYRLPSVFDDLWEKWCHQGTASYEEIQEEALPKKKVKEIYVYVHTEYIKKRERYAGIFICLEPQKHWDLKYN